MATWVDHTIDTLGSRGAFPSIIEGGKNEDLTIIAADAGANTFVVATDVTATFTEGTRFVVFGSTGNDGVYEVVSAVYGAPNTTITVASVVDDTDDGELALLSRPGIYYYMLDSSDDLGKLRYAQTDELLPAASTDWTLLTVDTADSATIVKILLPHTIVVSGDHSDYFTDGVYFRIDDGTYAGNYTCNGNSSYSGGDDETTITVDQDLSAIAGTEYPIVSNTDATHFEISGNHTGTFSVGVVFTVTGSVSNDATYTTVSSTWNEPTNITSIEVASIPDHTDITGSIYLQVTDGTNTVGTGGTGYHANAEQIAGLPHCVYTHRRYGYIDYVRATRPGPATALEFARHRIKLELSAAADISLAAVNALPHVAFNNEPALELRYARSDSAEPTSSGNWTEILIDSGMPSAFRHHTPLMLTDTLPKIISTGDNHMWFNTAASATPTLATDFTEVQATAVDYAPAAGVAGVINDTLPLVAFRCLLTNTVKCVHPWSVDIYSADAVANEFEVTGDYSTELGTGVVFTVIGSYGNDGTYTSTGASYSGGTGRTTVSVSSVADTTDNGRIYLHGLAATADFQIHTIDTGADLGEALAIAVFRQRIAVATADAVTNEFTVTGNYADEFAAGRMFRVFGSTGNDDIYVSTGASYATGTTTISVASVADGTDDGTIELLDDRPMVFYSDNGTTKRLQVAIADRPNPSDTAHWAVETIYTGTVSDVSAKQVGDYMCAALYDSDSWDLVFVSGTF